MITIEREINVVHERGTSFISQREAHGGADEMMDVARAALREDPDVLVLESCAPPRSMDLALDAAASGRLVIGGFPAHNATGAVDRIIDLFPPEDRRQVQIALAQNLRGVIVQVLLQQDRRRTVAARELLLNTPAVAERDRRRQDVAAAAGRSKADASTAWCRSTTRWRVRSERRGRLREAFQRRRIAPASSPLCKRQGIDTSRSSGLAYDATPT